jgi:hypothetical protein
VAGAYRAAPIKELEKKVLVPPIDIYYSKLRVRHIRRTYCSPAGVLQDVTAKTKLQLKDTTAYI